MAGWDGLERELDRWEAAGRCAGLWWRDDDAATPGPMLMRLLDLSAAAGVPLALAAIPAAADEALGAAVCARTDVTVLQHGYAHRNHAPAGAKKAELGGQRPAARVRAELVAGRRRLAALCGARWLGVLVPPWNRVAPGLVPMLPGIGYLGLSTYGPRQRAEPAPGLCQVNTHIDIVEWHRGRDFVGEAAALRLAGDHLAARRQGRADAAEPTGLLSHHAVHDPAAWDFLARFLAVTGRHPAVRWLTAAEAFGRSAAAPRRAPEPAPEAVAP